jgi:deoxyribose-phosphate aldolase
MFYTGLCLASKSLIRDTRVLFRGITVNLSRNELAKMIDHTLLKPNATRNDISRLCEEGKTAGFASVCVNSCWVTFCARNLTGSTVNVCSVVGFPLGAAESSVKAYEAKKAVEDGASEIDMVMNVGRFLSGAPEDREYVKRDIEQVVEAAFPLIVKVILETGFLGDEQIIQASNLAREAGAHFVKTSTGFGPPFETHHITLMRQTVGQIMGVKAAGGIRDYQRALEVIEAGANRIGASAGVKILEGAP